MVDPQKLHAELLVEYGEAIDTSTLLAILSDYDLTDDAQLSAARQILDILKDSAPDEERSGFEPSATGGANFRNIYGDEDSVSARSLIERTSRTDDTSFSLETPNHNLAELDLNSQDAASQRAESPARSYATEFDSLDDSSKEAALGKIFPTLRPFDIRWTLKKCKQNASLAIDELMTQSFLEESGTRHKSVEAFSESDIHAKSRNTKGKKWKTHAASDETAYWVEQSPVQSKWDSGRQDIDFLSEKTNTPVTQISSLYHKNGASLRATISAIIEAHEALNMDFDDPVMQINVSELRQEFPSVPAVSLETLLQITHPSVNDARDLAKALASTTSTAKSNGIQIEIRHKPIEEEPESVKPRTTAHNDAWPMAPLDFSSAASKAGKYQQSRDAAYTQASAAYRKSKSDHLMGGAAAYYSQIGRDLGDRARNMESAAADALVAQQSSKTELDLHGVNVKDAVRLSRERVTTWWHELGEARIHGRGGIGSGYRIVTGVGRHSEGGKGKLGPAVGKMLIKEGWKVEVGSGVLLVTGVAKR